MKTLLAALSLVLAVASNGALAQTYKLTWALTGFTAGGVAFPWLELDVSTTGRYMAAHGAILTDTRQLSPVTGTCAPLSAGYFCHLMIDRNSYFLALDGQLNGKITGKDGTGTAVPEATVKLHSRQ